MGLLKLLEGFRFPLLNYLMQAITYLGEETIFMVVAIVVFWCVDKRRGYYILSVGFFGTLVNQFMKLAFRVPRPWVKDPSFTIVESARSGATGYSFPSGHTQNAVGTFGCMARATKRRWVRIVCIALALLVSFSRMYLGAHYPSDVGVALVFAVVLVFALYPLIEKTRENWKTMLPILGVMIACGIAYLLYVYLYPFPADIDPDNYAEGAKNGWSLLGALLGLSVAYVIDETKTRFDEKAPLPGQLCKAVLGLALILGIRAGLKSVFGLISDGLYWNAPRYFCMVLFACAVWPKTFPFWAKLGKK